MRVCAGCANRNEATSYTDPENEAVIQSALAKLVQGKTLLVIAHRLSTIADADQIIVVNLGRIEATGAQAELLGSCPLHRTMWEAHISVKRRRGGGVMLTTLKKFFAFCGKENRKLQLDLSKYFDTLNHEKLLNLLRETIKDERVIQLIKKFLKSGVMENGVKIATTEGSPQGGPLSPLLANVYLNEFDWEYERRGVPVIRYADDIVLLCKSQRAAERLLESSIRYLEGKLKLRVNRDKSHIARVNATKNFKFLGFAYGKGKDGLFIRAHPKALLKAKNRLRAITKRNRGVNVRKVMQEIKVYMTGWLNYYGIASLKTKMREWDEWLRHRIRAYIWKQWKKPKTKLKNLMKLGVPEYYAHMAANSRRGYWFTVNTGAVTRGITNERLTRAGFFELSPAYESIQTACIGRAVYRTVRTVR